MVSTGMFVRGALARYGLSIAVVALCLSIRLILEPVMGHLAPFILFIPGILVSAWYGGFGPGVLASALSVILAEYALWDWRLTQGWQSEVVRSLSFFLVGIVMSYWEDANLRARRELERTHQQVNAIFGSITDAFCTLDRQFRFMHVNEQAQDLFGGTVDQLRGRPLERHAVALVACLGHCRQAMASGQTVEWEEFAEGSGAWYNCKAYPYIDGLSLFLRDITKQKQAERKLRETGEMLSAIVRASPLPIVALDPQGLITLWNAAAERLFGWHEEEVLGRHIPFIPDEQSGGENATQPLDLASAHAGSREVRRLRKDGAKIDLHVSTAFMRDQNGRVQGVMSVYVDVTERKRAEEIVRQSEAQLRLITDALPVLISYVDLDQQLRFANRTHQEWLSLEDQPLTGRDLREILPEPMWEEVSRRLNQVKQGEEAGVWDWSGVRPDGVPMTIRLSYIPDRGPDGTLSGFVVMAEDLTKLKEDEQALREINQKLQRANDDLRQFSYAASHDLQEPLRTVIAYSQLLERQYRSQLDDKARDFIDYIVGGAKRMSNMLQALRQYWQAGSSNEPLKPVNCAETLDQALLNLEMAIESSGAKVTYDSLPTVQAHDVALVQLWQNLISNAIKYRGEDPPRIHIDASGTPAGYLFTVEDNGIGIAPEDQDRVFGVFKRLHGAEYPGTGIGLAMCSKIVERYGGRIWVESEVGHGARFRFTLPPAPAVTMQHALESGG